MTAPSQIEATRAFFGPRARGWEERFPDDAPAFQLAINELRLQPGQTAIDVGCGTGRALPLLRAAVGATGWVIGLDTTPEMLAEVQRLGRVDVAALALADALRLPVADGAADAILAAGLLGHLTDPLEGLVELARATKPGGRLAIFHPISRVALAARHGGVPSPEDILAPDRLKTALQAAGWALALFDDAQHRYLAVAVRGG